MIPYIGPTETTALPKNLTLTQFLQTVFVGISGLPGDLVRPRWQPNPPKRPEIETNWMGVAIMNSVPDANAYTDTKLVESTVAYESQRNEILEIGCSVYGPEAIENYGLIRDGFQIPNNLAALNAANMGIVEVGRMQSLPEFFNERWWNRVECSVFIRRKIQREYPIPTLISALGQIHTVIGGEDYTLDWNTEN